MNDLRRWIRLVEHGLDQRLMSDNPDFARWFRNSVVVDQQGQPLVMYHSTFSNFTSFHRGSHFGDKDAANQRWNNLNAMSPRGMDDHQGSVIPVYLSIQKPLRIPDDSDNDLQDAAKLCRAALKVGAITPDQDQVCRKLGRWDDCRNCLFKLLRKQGYDGMVYKNTVEGTADSYIIFSSNQVKSAFNTGDFSRRKGNIGETAQMGPTGRSERLEPSGDLGDA